MGSRIEAERERARGLTATSRGGEARAVLEHAIALAERGVREAADATPATRHLGLLLSLQAGGLRSIGQGSEAEAPARRAAAPRSRHCSPPRAAEDSPPDRRRRLHPFL